MGKSAEEHDCDREWMESKCHKGVNRSECPHFELARASIIFLTVLELKELGHMELFQLYEQAGQQTPLTRRERRTFNKLISLIFGGQYPPLHRVSSTLVKVYRTFNPLFEERFPEEPL